jgi:hypothetical protein
MEEFNDSFSIRGICENDNVNENDLAHPAKLNHMEYPSTRLGGVHLLNARREAR